MDQIQDYQYVRVTPLSKRLIAVLLQVLYPLEFTVVIPLGALVTRTITHPFVKSILKILVVLDPPPPIRLGCVGTVGTVWLPVVIV